MIYYFAQQLQAMAAGTDWEPVLSPLRVFRYITLRSAGAAITALLLSLWLGWPTIRWLKSLRFGQSYADKAEEGGKLERRIKDKRGTPTMGGILIVLVIDLTVLLWARWNELILLSLLSLIVLAGLGFYDDYLKVAAQSGRGISSRLKLVVQSLLAAVVAGYLLIDPPNAEVPLGDIMVPFFKDPILTGASVVGVLITMGTIVGSSNAVNLTDGLDGLAIGCTLIVTSVFFVFTYVACNVKFADYLDVPYVAGAGELTVFCAAMLGAGLGFLWFNCHPAQVFMGDTGSLALGGVLGIISVLVYQPFVLFIAGGIFVAEAVSVMLQTGWFKYTRRACGTGRRLFLMAPLHHHFERKGWYESQVVTRFYILCLLCAVVALSTLKIR